MFNEEILVNPFSKFEGIYKIVTKTDAIVVKAAISKLDLEIFKKSGTRKSSVVAQIVAVHNLYGLCKPDTRISRVYTLLGLSEKDVAKLCDIDVFNTERAEYWQITCKAEDFKKMGTSTHWSSCYRETPYYTDPISRHSPCCLIRQMDAKGGLLRRFVIAGNWRTYPGQRESLILPNSNIGTANSKGITKVKALQLAKEFVKDKAIKLEGDELANFKWTG